MDLRATLEAFFSAYDRSPAGVWAAPGRVNLIGEHTDYNDGFVLPLALQQCVRVAAAPAEQPVSRVRSLQRPGEATTFEAASVEPGSVRGSAAYVAGVVWALRSAGHPVGDVELLIDGEVPIGAGLGSSAALECAVALALADLHRLTIEPTTMATLARRAENDFVGVPTGVMDQMAALHGRPGHALLIDTRSLAVEHIAIDLGQHGVALVVIDTGAPHALVDSAYADRRSTCEAAAVRLGVPALRDVDTADLARRLDDLPDDVSRRRVRHVVTENHRVSEVVDLLRSGTDPRAIGAHLNASHGSLRDDFEVSAPTLDLAVDAALEAGAHGARMTGGGFGGCAIALVDEADVGRVGKTVGVAFAEAGWAEPAWFLAVPSAGARRLL